MISVHSRSLSCSILSFLARLWLSARRKLGLAKAILPLLRVSLGLSWGPLLATSDGCPTGYGACERKLSELVNVGGTTMTMLSRPEVRLSAPTSGKFAALQRSMANATPGKTGELDESIPLDQDCIPRLGPNFAIRKSKNS